MAEKLEELDKDLSNTTAHVFPEEYIRKTLIAHGFFTHAKILEDHKRQLKEGDNAKKPQTTDGISEEDKRRTTQLVYHYKEGKEFHSLKEPLKVQRKHRIPSSQIVPKWPAEVPCLDHCPSFIIDQPLLPEPLQKPDLSLIGPKIRSAFGEGTVVYNNRPSAQKFYIQSRSGPSTHEPYPRQRIFKDESLGFESRFESGNLAKAVKVGRWDYELYLRCDLYTQKHTQWFFFSVQNMKAGQTYRFTIVNLYKPSSLYNDGMQPLLHSEKRAKLHKIGWRRVGFNIKYFKTNIKRTGAKVDVNNYGLTWSYTFQYDNDTCYFTHCYPYTYTDLQDYLNGIAKDPKKSIFCKQRSLCSTIAGNEVPLLTITSPSGSLSEAQNKRTILVTARVHPGETNGSWMMKGMIDFLVSESSDAQILRDAFMFKIIPMLNPDGVIVGNYRCSLSGRDLNRNYKSQLKDAYPTIWHCKELIKQLAKEREVVLYCDFHGHSRKQNVFIYGCDRIQDPSVRLRSRVFPKMLSLNAPNKFSFRGCNFKVQKSKEGTGRVFMWREMGIINSYTMEATFCGSNLGDCQGFHFSTKELELMGYHFCDTLLDYCDPDQSKVEYVLNQLTDDYRQAVVDKLQSLGVEVPDGVDPLDVEFDSDILSGIDSSDEGSDSSESDGPPVQLMDKIGKKKRNKKLQTRKERNRRKAQLKLTHKAHHSPSHTQAKKGDQPPKPPDKSTKNANMVGSVTDESLNNATGTPVPANGGLPKFVQERISERQKKDNNAGVSNEPDYVESVTADYVRNGVPQNSSLLANKELQISTASLISQPKGCPIAISSMVLREPSTSRISSASVLPQIETEPSSDYHNMAGGSTRGAFASSYVANHLKDDSDYDYDDLAPNTTRNLMSLSKLFRTLKPHLAKPSGRQSLTNSDTADSGRTNSIGQLKVKPRKEYVSFDGNPITHQRMSSRNSHVMEVQQQQQQVTTNTTSNHQTNLVSSKSSTEEMSKKSSSGASVENSKLPPVIAKSGSLTSQGATLSAEKVTSTSQTDTLRQNGTLKQPITIMNGGNIVIKESQSPSTSSLRDSPTLLHLMQPPTTSLELSLKKNTSEAIKQEIGKVPGSNRGTNHLSSSVRRTRVTDTIKMDTRLDGLSKTSISSQLENIEVHKQKIATAVETIQNKRKLFKETVNHHVKNHPRPHTSSSSYSKNRPHTSSSFPPNIKDSPGNNSGGVVSNQRAVLLGYPSQNSNSNNSNSNNNNIAGRRDIQTSESHYRQRIKPRTRNKPSPSDDEEDLTLPRWKIYYSNKSTTIKDKGGITPSTVSLMLPAVGQYEAPATPTVSSSHPVQSKSHNTRYYSNYKKGIFQ